MQKKNILIVFTGSMELGGIERSLLGLLDAIDYDYYDVDLFLYGHHGPLFSLINPKVNILPEVKELAYLREPQENKVIRGNIGHYPIIIPIKGAIELEDYKINLLTHIGKLVSEIRFILAELLDSIMDYKPFEGMNYNSLFYENLSDVFIMFKIRLIKEKKKHIIENKDYSVSLNDLFNEKEYDTILNDKDTVLSTLVSSFKKREKVQAMLDDIDEHYYISKSVKFEKRKLAIIVYILQYCELFNRMSYETFKKNICWYYGKENVSMKPNKIQEEAIQEYYKKEFLYKKYNISIK